MLNAVNDNRSIHAGNINDAFNPQKVRPPKLHQHGQTGFEKYPINRLLKRYTTCFDLTVPI